MYVPLKVHAFKEIQLTSTWLASARAINTYRVTSVLAPTYYTYYAARLLQYLYM